LFARALFGGVSQKHYNIAAAIELIHNATLIHDDVIDSSDERRGNETLNKAFDAKLAVVAGDFLFTLAFMQISKTGSVEIIDIYAQALKEICTGEIEQYFNKFKVPSIEDYIEKSKNKTAMLFYVGLYSAFLNDVDEEKLEKIKDFALNFGIAFQIKDDLVNVLNADKNAASDDIKNGIYTAPVIFSSGEGRVESGEGKVESGAIQKTKNLIKKYVDKAVDNLDIINDNEYKKAIKRICELVKDVGHE